MAIKWVDRVPTYANRVRIVPEDGSAPYYATMERADQPTVVGTPINAANLNAMQEAAGLTAHRTVYVATTGSDTTGDGSQTAPYATITKALTSIPKNLNGYTASVNIAAGTYNESVYAAYFGNGLLRITGVAGAVVTVNKIEFFNVKYVEIDSISFHIQSQFFHVNASSVRVQTPFSANGSQYGVYASYFSNVTFRDTVTINGVPNAIFATSGSNIYVEHLLGSGNTVAFASTQGSLCAFNIDESTATTKYYTLGGGRIFSGSQINMPVN